jgi:hypothetical protein
MLRKYFCAALVLILGLVAQSRAGYAIAVDPVKDGGTGYARMPLPTHRVGPELILFSRVSADLFPDCETDEAQFIPVIVYVFLPSSEKESATMIAEVACVRKAPRVRPHAVSFPPSS